MHILFIIKYLKKYITMINVIFKYMKNVNSYAYMQTINPKS